MPVVGGDTTRADELVLTVTALGRSERVPAAPGARPGDLLVVTGPLGARRCGASASSGYVAPAASARRGPAARRPRTAMLDVSDGLAVDAGHIARALGLSAS